MEPTKDYHQWLKENDKGLSDMDSLSFSTKMFLDYIKNPTNKLDMDVYLESKGYNLQRGLVWDLKRKQEFILSMLLKRPIPNIYVARVYSPDWEKETMLVIDGKQRLSTALSFTEDAFQIPIFDGLYLFSELPQRFQREILTYHFTIKLAKSEDGAFPDNVLEDWFRLINFGGVSQME